MNYGIFFLIINNNSNMVVVKVSGLLMLFEITLLGRLIYIFQEKKGVTAISYISQGTWCSTHAQVILTCSFSSFWGWGGIVADRHLPPSTTHLPARCAWSSYGWPNLVLASSDEWDPHR